MADKKPEVWMRGPIEGVDPYLQPVVHSLLQVKEDLEALLPAITSQMLWARPGGAASLAFHLDHIGGATDRLLTYARGETLSPEQFVFLKGEGANEHRSLDDIAARAFAAIDRAIAQVRMTTSEMLLAPQKLGRAQLPTTTFGLLVHAAEHALRHIGQATTMVKVLTA
jgi:hypothetical protein